MVEYAQICALHSGFCFPSNAGVFLWFGNKCSVNEEHFYFVFKGRASLHIVCLFFLLAQSLSCCGLRWRSTGWIQWGCTRSSIRFHTHLCMNTGCYLRLSDRKICSAEHIAVQLFTGLLHWGCILLPWKSVVFSSAPLMHTSPIFLFKTTSGKGRWRPEKLRRVS